MAAGVYYSFSSVSSSDLTRVHGLFQSPPHQETSTVATHFIHAEAEAQRGRVLAQSNTAGKG